MNVILNRVTIDDVLSLGPCGEYNNRATLEALFAGRKSLDALEILDIDIPVTDRFWAIFKKEVLPESILHEVACRFAEQAFESMRKIGIDPDARSIAAVEAKRKWLKGEISVEKLYEARKAAADAAVTARAVDVADAAAAAVTARAADAAAVAARATDADAVAARAADAAAVYYLECGEQIKILKKIILEFTEQA